MAPNSRNCIVFRHEGHEAAKIHEERLLSFKPVIVRDIPVSPRLQLQQVFVGW